jgi:hypothetical protein
MSLTMFPQRMELSSMTRGLVVAVDVVAVVSAVVAAAVGSSVVGVVVCSVCSSASECREMQCS